ncbi:MAG: PQQ-dependent sugar dehydrogenase, partial [Candidatus Rokuibacteriota bacterium]
MRRALALLLGTALLWANPARAVGDGNNLLPDIPAGPSTVRLRLLADVGADAIMDIANAGDGTRRLFLVSPRGVIRIFQNGALLGGFFLNEPASPTGSAMSSLAFHPLYASNRKLYVITGEDVPNGSTPHYSPPQNDTGTAFDNIVVEYLVQSGNPNAVDTTTRRELLRMHKPEDAHNVNDLVFAPSGMGHLLIATGDGGLTRTGTPTQYQTNAQPTTLPYGKFLRIDVDSIGPNGRYAIPPDNPFASGAGGNVPEIYAWGVRNPWRITRDRLTGTIYSGVNGDFTIEQVYRVELGRNPGWATNEGSFLWDPVTGNASVDPDPLNPPFTPPLAQYDHNGTTQAFGSVIGGYVYRGARMP